MSSKGSGGGSSTTNTTATPWSGLQPYLTGGLENIATSFGLNSNGSNGGNGLSTDILGNPYPGSVVAPDSAQTTQALGQRANIANNSGLSGAANNYNQDVLNGKYLDPASNPYLQSTYNQAAKSVTDNYNNVVNPGIDSAANTAGRYGSGAYAALRNQSDTSLGNSLNGLATDIYGGAYNTERTNMQQALSLAPQTTTNNYTDSNQLASVGDYYTNLGQQQLNSDISNYNTLQQQPLTALQTYMNLINGVSNPTSSSTTSNQRQASNGFAQTVGTGLSAAASLASLFSDRNLKENIVPVGEENGHKIYEFNYIGSPERYVGVMAQDVLLTNPEAVVQKPEGLAVNYDMIGVKMRKI